MNNLNIYSLKSKLKKGTLCLSMTSALLTGCASKIGIHNQLTVEQENNMEAEIDDRLNSEYASFYLEGITNEDIYKISAEMTDLTLYYCPFLTDLSMLPDICPNIKSLYLRNLSGLDDISFIYKMHNLSKIEIYDIALVDEELVNYLNEHDIEHNITDDDLRRTKMVNKIYDEIIDDNMSEEEKITAISFYVSKNFDYDISLVNQSSNNPLTCILDNKAGVCSSYSYLNNILLRKAGINAYEIRSNDHCWNLVELSDKYYYIDPTIISAIPLNELRANLFNRSMGFMTNPGVNILADTQDFNDREECLLPSSLVSDIEKSERNKNLFEKYINSMPVEIAEYLLSAFMTGFCGVGLGFNIYDKIKKKRK